jgi:SM-20-related protein
MREREAAIPVLDAGLELSPKLDHAALAAEFASRGRVHIPEILTHASALRLYQALTEQTPWRLTVNKGTEFLDYPKLPEEERTKIAAGAWQRAHGQFQYLFDNHRLSHNGEPYRDATHYFARLVAFLNAPHFRAFIRDVTGIEGIAYADAQATFYRPGDFLTLHDDHGFPTRRVAYVLNMTPGWNPDWGGILNFYDARGHVVEGFVPAFNALNVFRVPTDHSVSQVSIFGGYRYSVTGWFHAARKP